jgi:hypothetical protein
VNTRVERAVIVGMGEVGSLLAVGARACGVRVSEVRRGESIADAAEGCDGPIVLAMREDDFVGPLREALSLRPASPESVVVLQNGFIDEELEGRSITRGVLWFTKKGDFFASARDSVLAGRWAEELARWLDAVGARSAVTSEEDARREGREKAAWSCLVGPGVFAFERTFAEMLSRDERASRRIVEEACDVASRTLGERVSREGAWAMVEQTVGPLGWMRGGPKGLAWRSGKVVEWAERMGDGYAAIENGEVVRRILSR